MPEEQEESGLPQLTDEQRAAIEKYDGVDFSGVADEMRASMKGSDPELSNRDTGDISLIHDQSVDIDLHDLNLAAENAHEIDLTDLNREAAAARDESARNQEQGERTEAALARLDTLVTDYEYQESVDAALKDKVLLEDLDTGATELVSTREAEAGDNGRANTLAALDRLEALQHAADEAHADLDLSASMGQVQVNAPGSTEELSAPTRTPDARTPEERLQQDSPAL